MIGSESQIPVISAWMGMNFRAIVPNPHVWEIKGSRVADRARARPCSSSCWRCLPDWNPGIRWLHFFQALMYLSRWL